MNGYVSMSLVFWGNFCVKFTDVTPRRERVNPTRIWYNGQQEIMRSVCFLRIPLFTVVPTPIWGRFDVNLISYWYQFYIISMSIRIQYNIYIERLFYLSKMFPKEPSLKKAFEGSKLCGCPDILWQTIPQMRPTCRESPVAIRWSRAYGSQTKTRRRRPRTARGSHKWELKISGRLRINDLVT
jgi:hypothetical protein